MKKTLMIFELLEALPLPVFLLYATLIDQSITQTGKGHMLQAA